MATKTRPLVHRRMHMHDAARQHAAATLNSNKAVRVNALPGFEGFLKAPAPELQAPESVPGFWQGAALEELGFGRFDRGVWGA